MAANKLSLKVVDPLKCFACKSRVVDPVLCPGCQAAYHPSCASSKTSLIPGVGYAKCCGSRPSSPLSPGVLDSKTILDSLRHELKVHSDNMSKEFNTVTTSVSKLTEDFKAFGNRLTTVESDLSNLTERIDDVEVKVAELEQRPVNSSGTMSDFINEWEERQKRKKNVMLFGLGEARGADRQSDSDSDRRTIHDFVSLLLPGILDPASFNYIRIGKFSQMSAVTRPVKLSLPSEELAFSLIRSAVESKNEARTQGRFKDVVVAYDRTKKQMDEYRDLRKVLESRVAGGEKNLRIVYRNGIPRILTSAQPDPSQRLSGSHNPL